MSLALASPERPLLAARLRGAAEAALARQHGRFGPWLAVALGAGVLLYFRLPEEPPGGALWLGLILAVPAFLIARRATLAGWAVGLVAAGLMGFGVAGWHAARLPPPLDLPRNAVAITGIVTQVELLPQGRRVTLERARIAEGEPLPRSLRIRLRADDPARPAPGDTLSLRATLRPPAAPVVPGAWDFQRAAYFAGRRLWHRARARHGAGAGGRCARLRRAPHRAGGAGAGGDPRCGGGGGGGVDHRIPGRDPRRRD